MTKKDISFNDAIAEVEAILKKIETGILDVDRLSESVKRASELIKICQKKLRDAEVEIGKIFTEPQKDQ
jgi:exodeoxyribonuclease VII small subunit